MKKILLTCALLCSSLSAFGQSNQNISTIPQPDSKQTGFYVGFDYMNLTERKMQAKYSTRNRLNSGTSSDSETTHLGTVGVRAGYSLLPSSGLGVNAGLRFAEAFNRSEYSGSERTYFFIPEVNLQMALNQYVVPYAGVNISLWRGDEIMDVYRPGFGLQAGIGLRATQALMINAGYTLLTQSVEFSDYDGNGEADFALGGFSSNVTYTF